MTNINVPRNVAIAVCVGVGILLLTLAFVLFKLWSIKPLPTPTPSLLTPTPSDSPLILDETPIPVPGELTEYLRSRDFVDIMLLDKEGRVKIVGVDGKPIEPCGSIEGTRITGTCPLKGINLTNFNQILIFKFTHSPQATTCKTVGDRMVCYE